jgi:hypothetical protein
VNPADQFEGGSIDVASFAMKNEFIIDVRANDTADHRYLARPLPVCLCSTDLPLWLSVGSVS